MLIKVRPALCRKKAFLHCCNSLPYSRGKSQRFLQNPLKTGSTDGNRHVYSIYIIINILSEIAHTLLLCNFATGINSIYQSINQSIIPSATTTLAQYPPSQQGNGLHLRMKWSNDVAQERLKPKVPSRMAQCSFTVLVSLGALTVARPNRYWWWDWNKEPSRRGSCIQTEARKATWGRRQSPETTSSTGGSTSCAAKTWTWTDSTQWVDNSDTKHHEAACFKSSIYNVHYQSKLWKHLIQWAPFRSHENIIFPT